MARTIIAVTLASICLVACSRDASRQAQGKQETPSASPSAQQPAPAPAPGAAASPTAAPASPEATSGSGPADTTRPTAAPPPPAAAPATEPAAPAPEPRAEPAPEPKAPTFREVTIPAGTSINVTLLHTLASKTSKPEDRVGGAVAKPVVVSGLTALPAGAQLNGTVTEVRQSGRVKGKAAVTFRFEQLLVRGESYSIQTAPVKQEAASTTRKDVKKGGLGAGLGAVVGGVAGGGKGAAIGAVAGGTGAVLATKGDEIEVPAGTPITVLLQEPVTVTVPVKKR